jgi:F-type H+-transporting ATPase subunit b
MVDLLILAEAAHEAGSHAAYPTALGLTPGGWVAMSMLAVFGIMIWMKVPALVASALDAKIEGIKSQLDEAAKLRAEAEALKAEYAAKLADAAKHGETMKAAAAEEAKAIVAKAKTDAKALIERRQKIAEDKIAAAERAAVDALRAKAARTAAGAAAGLIAQTHDARADQTLVEEAIAGI